MEIKKVKKEEKRVKFSSLNVGDTFIYDDELHVKIDGINSLGLIASSNTALNLEKYTVNQLLNNASVIEVNSVLSYEY